MKNFTNNFKQFTSRLSARWLIIAFMLLLGTGSAWGWDISGGHVYFDNSVTNWDDASIQFVIGHSSYSSTYQMTKIENTKLCYYSMPSWTGASYYGIIGTGSKWGDGNWGNGNLTNATHYTAAYTSKYELNSGSSYYLTPSSADNGCTLTITYKGTSYTTIPTYTATLAVQTRPGTSGTYSSITSGAPATLKLKGTILSANGTSSRTATGASEVTWPTTKTRTAVVTGLVTVSYSSLSAGYTFDGWYEGSTQKSTAASYSYNQSANTTITAKFTAKQFSINYKDQGGTNFSGTHASGYPTKHTYGTDTTLKTASKTGYTFGGWFTDSNCTQKVTSLRANAYTSNITLYAKWEKACDDVAAPTLSIDRGITNNCGVTTTGIIAITNYAQFSNCTFTLNGDAVNPTNTGKIEGVTASGSCTVVVTNNCGNSSDAVSIDMPKTTVKAPTVYDVSLTYPQVLFATNTGGVNIYLAQSERDVTYYLYKNGTEVTDSDKQGDGRALVWTVLESGTYTVKADNPCNGGVIDMNGSVEFTCMSNLELAFEGGKSTFCPGETANVIVTFEGTGKGDEDTNAGKFGWEWEGSNYTYQSVYLTESGVTMPVTINADGSIQLNVKTCNGPLSSNTLNFTVVTAPEIPQLDDYAKEVCTGETAEIIISPYNDSYNYNLYKGEQKVDTPEFNAGVFTVSEAGSYTVKAVEAECSLASKPSDPFTLTTRGTTITPSVAEIHPYEVVTFTAGEQAKWALYTNPSSGSQLSDDDAKYSGKDTAYITKGESRTTTFKGEAANGYVIHATVGDCTASYTFNVVEDPDNCQ